MSVVIRLILLSIILTPLSSVAGADVLSPYGYGVIRFGMKVETAEAALKQRTTQSYSKTGCDYVEFKRYPGLRFMIEDGILTRADARKNIKNSANVGIGMSLTKVKGLHPSIKIEPHKYDDEGHYLILKTDDGRAAIVFEESNGKVTDIRAGMEPAVEYVEGCL